MPRITRRCRSAVASPPVTTKGPSQLLHTFCTKAPIRMLHFSKLPQRSRFVFSFTHSDSSPLSHVVLPFTMAATLPTHPPLPPHPHISHRYPSISPTISLSPFLFRFGHTNTDHRHAGERESSMPGNITAADALNVGGEISTCLPPDILHRFSTEPGSTFPDPGGCCSLGSSGASVHCCFYLG